MSDDSSGKMINNNAEKDMDMDNVKEQMLEKIQDAELVLVGLGEDFDNFLEGMQDCSELTAFMERISEDRELHWLNSYVEAVYLRKYADERKKSAYQVLERLLADKNYFVISTCMDDYIYDTNINKEKIVTPCGGYQALQCEEGCEHTVYDVPQGLVESIYESITTGQDTQSMKVPVCPVCGKPMIFNNKRAGNYVEAGYLPQWQKYTGWLQGTVNKRLCVLELGVGMKYPNVIRWPFEKIVYFNQKACIFRVHSKLYQLTEEIKDKGYKIAEKPIDFLINRFV